LQASEEILGSTESDEIQGLFKRGSKIMLSKDTQDKQGIKTGENTLLTSVPR
jgi:hypothetical protein